MADTLRKINSYTHKFFLIIAELALAAMLIIVTMTVIMRYCFNTGISWAEEVPRLLMTLFAFLACAMGVRDHTHIFVSVIYNRFKKGGNAQKALDYFTDFCILLCGLFMFIYGGQRCLKMMKLPGKLPMTGLRTWWQYVPIVLSGFLISFDSILFLTGILKPHETLFTEQDVDYSEQVMHIDKEGHIIPAKVEAEAVEAESAPPEQIDTKGKEGE